MRCDHIKLDTKINVELSCTGSPRHDREARVVYQKLKIIGYRDTEYKYRIKMYWIKSDW